MFFRPTFSFLVFRDRAFLSLLATSLVTFLLMLMSRHSSLERTSLPFNLGLSFFIVNLVFAGLSLVRDPFLAYMFLTATIVGNTTLIFFFRYLVSVR